MTAVEEVLYTIKSIKTKGSLLSKAEILSVLKATKSITKHKQIVNALIFAFTNVDSKNYKNTSLLTSREQQILKLIGNGNESKTIAIQLELSISTIETHRKNIRKKLGLVGNGKLLEYAILNNLQQNTSN
ncbi:MAG: hypothetical protein GXO84_00725 [Chlorobi bacterium]|nr:hypothetical protein [Chlorobiota bacterium]